MKNTETLSVPTINFSIFDMHFVKIAWMTAFLKRFTYYVLLLGVVIFSCNYTCVTFTYCAIDFQFLLKIKKLNIYLLC
jgi:hypothetical protein